MLISAAEAYRLWAPTYNSTVNPLIALEGRAMRELLPAHRPPRVVDVGCGAGRWMKYFERAGSAVAGIDACPEMLLEANRSPALAGRVAVGESGNLPIAGGTAALVICSFALGYFSNVERSFAELSRISAPGGYVAVSDMHPMAVSRGWTRSFKTGAKRYEIEQFRYSLTDALNAAAGAGLELVDCRAAWLGQPEWPLFQKTGKEHLFAEATRIPAVWLGLWKKHWS